MKKNKPITGWRIEVAGRVIPGEWNDLRSALAHALEMDVRRDLARDAAQRQAKQEKMWHKPQEDTSPLRFRDQYAVRIVTPQGVRLHPIMAQGLIR